jgi:hypothetical protein
MKRTLTWHSFVLRWLVASDVAFTSDRRSAGMFDCQREQGNLTQVQLPLVQAQLELEQESQPPMMMVGWFVWLVIGVG